MSAYFGPAGNSESFSLQGYKKTVQVPEYLSGFDLDAYEYQCGRGVKVSEQSAQEFGESAKKYNIKLSLHSPYYISLSSVEKQKRDKSIEYILQSAAAAKAMGAKRVIVHSGSCSQMTRQEALSLAKDTLMRAKLALNDAHLDGIHICPETMGKINQLGDLNEVMELCKVDDSFIPCIDFGHLNARTLGGIKGQADFEHILNVMENELGFDRLNVFHSHFSKIEYTEKGGEKRHLTFEDNTFGPEFEPLAELIAKKGISPTFICESAGTQAEDSAYMRKVYLKALQER